VEHAYPSKLVGWLVIALRRHATALHELTPSEFAELGQLLERTVRVLHQALGTGGFEHIHFHVVPRAHDLPEEFRGAGSFALLACSREEAADPDAVRSFCESLRAAFAES
jgi:diadenosine tetraphosphate (Ap4A) HIT family hydrolase